MKVIKLAKKKPFRVIIRCNKKSTIQKAVAELVAKFDGADELRISKIHRG